MHSIPAVHRFLSDERVALYEPLVGRENLKRAVAYVLDQARNNGASSYSFESLREQLLASLERLAADGLTQVINATGTILHTNLGRAPLAGAALEAAAILGGGYTNLEYDLIEGERGSRYSRLGTLLREVSGAEDGVVVNNCAAAVLLVLDTFAKDREVVVARNQLIEIGGGFRLPDVFERSGAHLVEVGASNKVYLHDFERALSARTALVFRSHLSNFRMTGFTHDVSGSELVQLGKRAGIPVIEDLGSGALVDLAQFGLPHERTVQDAVGEGIGLVAFSGDKLLGGPQAGMIVGKRALVARLRANPLIRALRVDKITLALLSETLRQYGSPETLISIPFFRMLATTIDELNKRADAYRTIEDVEVLASQSRIGGGALPDATLPSVAVALPDRDSRRAAALRRNRPAIVARNENARLVLDLRTIAPSEDAHVIAALRTLP